MQHALQLCDDSRDPMIMRLPRRAFLRWHLSRALLLCSMVLTKPKPLGPMTPAIAWQLLTICICSKAEAMTHYARYQRLCSPC